MWIVKYTTPQGAQLYEHAFKNAREAMAVFPYMNNMHLRNVLQNHVGKFPEGISVERKILHKRRKTGRPNGRPIKNRIYDENGVFVEAIRYKNIYIPNGNPRGRPRKIRDPAADALVKIPRIKKRMGRPPLPRNGDGVIIRETHLVEN